jgi:hypothetical protein
LGKGACVVAFNPYCTEVIEEKMKCAFIDATYNCSAVSSHQT